MMDEFTNISTLEGGTRFRGNERMGRKGSCSMKCMQRLFLIMFHIL